jgi:hypothetical protein
MKIFEMTNQKYSRFKDLKSGDVFRCKGLSIYFMKVENENMTKLTKLNAVDLMGGCMVEVEDDDLVIPIDAVIHTR